MSEKEFQAQVVQLARLLGWRVYHTHDSRRSPAGFPDLVLVRNCILFVELKTDCGTVKLEPTEWIEAIVAAGGTAAIWRPKDWKQIEAILR